ncbi:MAG: hypothetical protein RLZZ267_287 [Bacillota bacterium]
MRRWREGFTRLMHLPGDALLDVSRLTWIGRNQLHIENHRGLIRFQSGRLVIATLQGPLEITGQQLELQSMTADEMFIVGAIAQCSYISETKESTK